MSDTRHTAAIVDPAWDVEEVLALAHSKDIRITDILLTHSHHDHVNGIEKVLDHRDAQIHLLKAEAQFWGKALVKPAGMCWALPLKERVTS